MAVKTALSRTIPDVEIPSTKVGDYFASNTFSNEVMKEYLSEEAFNKVRLAVQTGQNIEEQVIEEVAAALKKWGISKGATHYSHWFQPQTGGTAEKHDSFFDIAGDGHAIEKFKGSALVLQESDASSFPSGGLRATFEARGYTIWDPSSPAFILYNRVGSGTLFIPSIFLSYSGEMLDLKFPLLKSKAVLNEKGVNVARIFDENINKITVTCGIEQEYFLIDKVLFNSRPDLVMCGRTVFGHSPAKGQQLEDHYLGSIPSRVSAFMVDFEFEALKLGIPVRTRHNEVAPGQFEVAPTFEEANIANDHNILLMEVMKRVASKHNFEILFHEKPFAGINGSGKHNNWSLLSDTGVNLLAPNDNPYHKLMFLTFLVNMIKAVYDHSDLLRATVTSANNEYRLGANEAPPAIVSIFLGSTMSQVLHKIENSSDLDFKIEKNLKKRFETSQIPSVFFDNTDRNRTSPFAFTGNKFEFRAVGSSDNSATPLMVLNTILANQLDKFKSEYDKEIETPGQKDKEAIILNILKNYIKESKSILFEGNSYSKEWESEAENRGLSNIKNVPEALKAFISDKTVDLFESMKVLNRRELHSRYEIKVENYVKKIQIESRVIGDLAQNHVVTTAIKYQARLAQTIKDLMELGLHEEAEPVVEIVKKISYRVKVITQNVKEMTNARKKANHQETIFETAKIYSEEVKPYFSIIRREVDKLELAIDDQDWPLTKYREILYMR